MRLPRLFNRPELRDQNYTDAVAKGLLSQASGEVTAGLTSAVEICAGWWGRAFSSAEVRPAGILADALKLHLSTIGRRLVSAGEIVFALDFSGGLTFLPASSVTVKGGPNPRSWVYELTLPGPSSTLTRKRVSAESILHITYSRSSSTPWQGVGPIEASRTTRQLLDNLERRLAQEAGGAVGQLIPVPNVEASAKLQADLRKMTGQVTLVETTSAAWGAGQQGAPQADYQLRRLGADPPATLRELRRQAEESLLGSCGIPTSVLGAATATSSRESFRQFLHATISPVADDVAAQIGAQLGSEISFDFSKLQASDISGRARAFQSMVGGGMDVNKAAGLAGLMESEE